MTKKAPPPRTSGTTKVKIGAKVAPVKKAVVATKKKVAPAATVKKNAVLRGTVKKGGTVKLPPPPRTTGTVKRPIAPTAKRASLPFTFGKKDAPAPARKTVVPMKKRGTAPAKKPADVATKRQQLAAFGAVSFSVVAASLNNLNKKQPAKKSPAPAAAKGKPAPARPASKMAPITGADLPASAPRPILPGANIGYKTAKQAPPRISNMQVKEPAAKTKEISEKPAATPAKTQKPIQAKAAKSNSADNVLIGLGGLGVYLLLNQPSSSKAKDSLPAETTAAEAEAPAAPATPVAEMSKAEATPTPESTPAKEPEKPRQSAREWIAAALKSRGASSEPASDRPAAKEWIGAWKTTVT